MKRSENSLKRAEKRFLVWRRDPKRGRRIPEELWDLAVEAAGENGVSRVVRELKLDFNALKDRLRAKKGPEGKPMEFVEVSAPLLPSPSITIQMEDGNGIRMRLECSGMGPETLSPILRDLWGARA